MTIIYIRRSHTPIGGGVGVVKWSGVGWGGEPVVSFKFFFLLTFSAF